MVWVSSNGEWENFHLFWFITDPPDPKGTHQGLVEFRENEEDKPIIDLEDVRNRILNELVEHIGR